MNNIKINEVNYLVLKVKSTKNKTEREQKYKEKQSVI